MAGWIWDIFGWGNAPVFPAAPIQATGAVLGGTFSGTAAFVPLQVGSGGTVYPLQQPVKRKKKRKPEAPRPILSGRLPADTLYAAASIRPAAFTGGAVFSASPLEVMYRPSAAHMRGSASPVVGHDVAIAFAAAAAAFGTVNEGRFSGATVSARPIALSERFIIKRIFEFSSYDRRAAISETADSYQDRILDAVISHGFTVDWGAIFRQLEDAAPSSLYHAIEAWLARQLMTDRLLKTMSAVLFNGEMLARYIQRRHEKDAGPAIARMTSAIEFEAAVNFASATAAAEYWARIMSLDAGQLEALRDSLSAFHVSSFALAGKVSQAVMSRVAELIAETIAKGLPREEFIKRARTILPEHTARVLEVEYRTRLTQSYGNARREQIQSRARAFPFIQYLAIKDGRTTPFICLPMGKAGPGGRGYIAASTDDIWLAWTPPNHYQCRSDLSPISFLEAQRMGILAKDGITRIALAGDDPMRPFGDPPKFAPDPKTGTLHLVAPALGFAA